MKRRPTQSIKEAIGNLFESDPNIYEKILEVRAKEYTMNIFDAIKKDITNIEIDDGVLSIRVNSSNIKYHILIEKNNLINQINEFVGVSLIYDIRVY